MSQLDTFEFVFYHIPKCGGSSIREYFKQLFLSNKFTDNEIYIACEATARPNIMDEPKLEFFRNNFTTTKILLAHINNHLYDKLNSKFNITCVRNPINRAISSFNHFILTEDPSANLVTLFKERKLDTIIKNCYDCPIWLRPNLTDYNFIVVFENLENDLSTVSTMLNIDNNLQVPHVDPAKKHKNNPNTFILNVSKSIHKHILNKLKTILAFDIAIYNNICETRQLNHLVI